MPNFIVLKLIEFLLHCKQPIRVAPRLWGCSLALYEK